ncbi:MAG: copper chaperone PCu(A)C [Pseudomonadota bacterium]|jgi:copper(I)-binding protein
MRAIVAALLLAASSQAVAKDPTIERAWIREAPPGAPAMAGFMAIEGGSRDTEIVGAHSADFGRVEIHEMLEEGGVMKMRPIERLEVPAGARLTLAPGAEHLMLFEAKRPLAAGDMVTITFELSKGDPVDVEFAVAKGAPGKQGDHAHHGH